MIRPGGATEDVFRPSGADFLHGVFFRWRRIRASLCNERLRDSISAPCRTVKADLHSSRVRTLGVVRGGDSMYKIVSLFALLVTLTSPVIGQVRSQRTYPAPPVNGKNVIFGVASSFSDIGRPLRIYFPTPAAVHVASDSETRTVAPCAGGALTVVRGFDAEVASWGGRSSLSVQMDGQVVDLARSAAIASPRGTVHVYAVLGATPDASANAVSYLLESDIGGHRESLIAEFQIDKTDSTISGLTIKDAASGAAVVYDLETNAVSCPSVGVCVVNCALNKLCSGFSPCELGLLIGEVAACVGGAVPACIDVAVDLGKAAFCFGVDCAAQCASGGGNPCAHSECVTGSALSKSCSTCATTVCAADPYCCNNLWDVTCVNEAKQWCGSTCSGGGNPSNCAHSPCVTGAALTKSCSSCVTTVCNADSYCCNNSWDSLCVSEAKQWCGNLCP